MKKKLLPLALFSILMMSLGHTLPALAQDAASDQFMKQNAPAQGNTGAAFDKNNQDVADSDFDSDVDEFATADNATGDDDF